MVNLDKNSKEKTNQFHSVLNKENVRSSYKRSEESRGTVIAQKTVT